MRSNLRIFIIFYLVGLLNACASQTDRSSQAVAKAADCPTQSTPLLVTALKQDEGFYERFDYHIRNIAADANTVKFQAYKYDFVFCRGNNTWTVQPGTLPTELQPPRKFTQYDQERYKTIGIKGKTYQYRVIVDPTASNPDGQRPEPQKVIFELITPESKQSQRHTLYTLNDLKQAKVGHKLGVPRITAALKYNNRLFWTVASEQGEGFNGIATIVSYDPQKNQSTIIQPEQIKRQQITDLVIAGDPNNPTFWMGTQISGEGNGYLSGMGLVAYRPNAQNLKSGSVKSYQVNNSPLIGIIPDKLRLENEKLWIGTGNGLCQLQWQAADNPQSWSCWRLALKANLPSAGLPIFNSLLNKTPADTLKPNTTGKTVEVLWWMPTNYETRKGRYEVRYDKGLTVTLNEQGAELWSPEVMKIRAEIEPGSLPFYWTGSEWHWNGSRFVRGLDAVASNSVGGGPRGIGSNRYEGQVNNWNAIRGDFDLLNLSRKSISIKHYSGWVDESLLKPYPTVLPQERSLNSLPNPLEAIAKQLRTQ